MIKRYCKIFAFLLISAFCVLEVGAYYKPNIKDNPEYLPCFILIQDGVDDEGGYINPTQGKEVFKRMYDAEKWGLGSTEGDIFIQTQLLVVEQKNPSKVSYPELVIIEYDKMGYPKYFMYARDLRKFYILDPTDQDLETLNRKYLNIMGSKAPGVFAVRLYALNCNQYSSDVLKQLYTNSLGKEPPYEIEQKKAIEKKNNDEKLEMIVVFSGIIVIAIIILIKRKNKLK